MPTWPYLPSALMTVLLFLFMFFAFTLAALRFNRFRVPTWFAHAVALVAPFVLAMRVLQSYVSPDDPGLGDYQTFWNGGRDLLEGRNPYAVVHGGLPFLNPPSTFPVFAALAKIPFRSSGLVWRSLNIILAVGLVGLARRTYNALLDRVGDEVGGADTAEISAAMILSTNVAVCLNTGQLGIFIAFMANLAVLLQAPGARAPRAGGPRSPWGFL